MKALLIVAHGSRKAEANRLLEELTVDLATEAKDRFSAVRCAYLQYSEPFAADMIDVLVKAGADHVVIFPFFLAAGGHVTTDIPELVLQSEKRYPGVTFETSTFLGGVDGLQRLVLEAVTGR